MKPHKNLITKIIPKNSSNKQNFIIILSSFEESQNSNKIVRNVKKKSRNSLNLNEGKNIQNIKTEQSDVT